MTCRSLGGGVIICGETRDITYKRIMFCPNCERRRRFGCKFGGIWYGDWAICLACGDEWSGGEWCPRPFRPRWRKDNITKGKKWWDGGVTHTHYRKWLRAELEQEFAS